MLKQCGSQICPSPLILYVNEASQTHMRSRWGFNYLELEKNLELSYILILIISAPEGSTHTHKVKTEECFCLLLLLLLRLLTEILLSWCGGVQKKKKKERKNSPGHLAEDLTCSLAVRGREAENALFPTLATFRFKDWKVKRCPYRWKPSSLPLSLSLFFNM